MYLNRFFLVIFLIPIILGTSRIDRKPNSPTQEQIISDSAYNSLLKGYQDLQKEYQELNMVDSAIFYCELSIKLNRDNNRFDELSRSYSAMHDLLRWSLGSKSEQTFILENLIDSALFNAIKSDNRNLIIENLIARGRYIHNYNHEAGLSDINRALDSLLKDDKFNPLLFEGLYQRGIVYFDNDQYQLAEADFLKCLEMIKANSKLKSSLFAAHSQLGRIYKITGQTRRALDHLNIAYKLDHSESQSISFGIYYNLADLYKTIEQKDSCIYFLTLQVSSLYEKFNQNSAQQIALTGAKFQISEHNDEIEKLSNENFKKDIINKSQKRFIGLLILSIISISILAFIIYKQYLKTNLAYQSIQEKNTQIAAQGEEIEFLKDQKREELTNRFEHDLELLEKLMKQDKLFLKPDLTLTLVAGLLKTNLTYLSSIINRHFGYSFIYYINQYRIKEAGALLNDGNHEKYSIEAISKMAGFKSKSAFYRAFREHLGCTPTEYLQRNSLSE